MKCDLYNGITVVVLLSLAISLVGCGGGSSLAPGLDGALVGTWQALSATEDVNPASLADVFDWDTNTTSMTMEFAANADCTVRELEDDTEIDSQQGTWQAQAGVGQVTMDGDVFDFTYVKDGNVLTITFSEEGHDYVVVWVKVINLTGHDASLIRAWKATGVTVAGAAVPVLDYFDVPAEVTEVTIQFEANGTATVRMVEADAEVNSLMTGTWATGGGTFLVDVDGEMRGIYQLGSLIITTGEDDGNTAVITWENWAPAAEHASALVHTWRASSVTVDGQPETLADFFDWDPGTDRMDVQFWSDGSMASVEYAGSTPGYQDFGVWSTSGSTLTIDIDEELVATYVLVANTVVVSFTEEGHDVVLTFTRVS